MSTDGSLPNGPSAPDHPSGSVTPATAPGNDNFASAAGIASLPFTATVDTTGATLEASEPQPESAPNYCPPVDYTVWYRYAPSTSGPRAIDSIGSTYPAVVAIYTGASLASLTLVTCSEQVNGNAADTIFQATAGTTYYVQAGGAYGASGTLKIRAVKLTTPANDRPTHATKIGKLPYTGSTEDIRAATTTSETVPTCAAPAETVWFAFTSPKKQLLRADILLANFEGFVAVYRGSGLTAVACGSSNNVAFMAQQGKTYFIEVGGITSRSYGTLKMRLRAAKAPANDNFAHAKPITALPQSINATTWTATWEPGEKAASCVEKPGASLWYSYTPATAVDIHISVSSSFGSRAAVFSGATLKNLVEVGCGDEYSIKLSGGKKYYIQLSGGDHSSGTLTLGITRGTAPSNDDFSHATHVTALQYESGPFSTTFATGQAGEPSSDCTSSVPAGSVWYKFDPTVNETVRAETEASNFDTVIDVYTGTALSNLVAYTCDDDSGNRQIPNALTSSITFAAATGTTYWLQVGGYGTRTGTLDLNMAPVIPPVNDNFANATPITPTYTKTVDTSTATHEANEADQCIYNAAVNGSTVWYSYTPSVTTNVTFAGGSKFSVHVGVFTGASMASLNQEACNANTVSWTATGGTTYWIQAGGSSGSTGELDVDFTAP